MTSEPEQPRRYLISALLADAIQPFPPMTDEDLADLAKSIGKNGAGMIHPVELTAEGRVVDGSQRLRAMQSLDAKYIDAAHVLVKPDVSAKEAHAYSAKANATRRHLTVEQKAAAARKMMRDTGMSQAEVARAFGKSPAAISQWLSQSPPGPDDVPLAYVIGASGKPYPVRQREEPPAPRLPEGAPRNPWTTEGHSYKSGAKYRRELQNQPLGELTPLQRAKLGQLLDDILEATTARRDELARLDEPAAGLERDEQD